MDAKGAVWLKARHCSAFMEQNSCSEFPQGRDLACFGRTMASTVQGIERVLNEYLSEKH